MLKTVALCVEAVDVLLAGAFMKESAKIFIQMTPLGMLATYNCCFPLRGLAKTKLACCMLKGIRVNAINPATVVTNFFTSAGMSQAQAEAYMDKSAKTHPIGRVGLPADIAELCYFLTDSGKAGWITGQASSRSELISPSLLELRN